MAQILKELVDIYKMPAVDSTHREKGATITIGDLHANTMKLIFMLIKHGIAAGIDSQEYLKLVEIYKTPIDHLTRDDLHSFNDILSKFRFDNDLSIRLIGDELADRGSNDYFTLKVLERLQKNNISVEILISNHTNEFLINYFTGNKFYMDSEFMDSYFNFLDLIDNDSDLHQDADRIIKKGVLPALKAISYSLRRLENNESELIIYSHAAIGLKNIENLANALAIEYNDDSAETLANTIDKINLIVQRHIYKRDLRTLCALYSSKDSDLTPFVFIIWNRESNNLDRPIKKNDYHLIFVHGHDIDDRTQGNIINLDNTLGKFEAYNTGEYAVLYSSLNDQTRTLTSTLDFNKVKVIPKKWLSNLTFLIKKSPSETDSEEKENEPPRSFDP